MLLDVLTCSISFSEDHTKVNRDVTANLDSVLSGENALTLMHIGTDNSASYFINISLSGTKKTQIKVWNSVHRSINMVQPSMVI